MSSFLSPRNKRVLLKILSWFSTASLLLTFVILPVQPIAHADIVDLDDMGAAGMITGYGMWNGTSLAYEIWEDVSSTLQTAGELVEGLWNQAYVELGTLPTYQSLSEYYASGVLQQYPVVGNTYTEIIIDQTTAQALDIFWDWALTQEGFTRDPETDLFQPPHDYVPSPLKHSFSWHSSGFVQFPANIPEFDCTAVDNMQIRNNVFPFRSVYGEIVGVWTADSQGSGPNTAGRIAIVASPTPNAVIGYTNNPTTIVLSTYNSYDNGNNYVYWSKFSLNVNNWGEGVWTPCSPFLSVSGYDAQVAWAMVYEHEHESYLEIPSSELILLPNPYAEDYVPQPVTIPTVIPYPPEYAPLPAPVPDPITGDFPEDSPSPSAVAQAVAQPMMQGAVSGELVQENPELDPEPEPSPVPSPGPGGDPVEVVTPFLPVQFPSFNFSLSGIWHYVVEWVGTLGSWFSLVFTIWSHLPYAIVVPVYATAVVVIVLGVYKRFFM